MNHGPKLNTSEGGREVVARGPQKYRAKRVEVRETQLGRGALRGGRGTDHPSEAKALSTV